MLLAHRAAFSRAVLLLNEADAHIVEGLALKERFHYVASATQLKLAIPQLTQREKLVLDRLMPVGSQPQATKLPFELKQTEVESYWRFYKYYPTFGEFAP